MINSEGLATLQSDHNESIYMTHCDTQSQDFKRLLQAECAHRRERLMAQMPPDSILIIAAAPVRQRNRDCDYTYRQDSNFYYLSGFTEPRALIVLRPNCPDGAYTLFCQARNAQEEMWQGRRMGVADAPDTLSCDAAYPIDDCQPRLSQMIANSRQLYTCLDSDPSYKKDLSAWIEQAGYTGSVHAIDPILHELRLHKSEFEIALMQQAAEISVDAHRRALKACHPDMMEYALEAEFTHRYRQSNAQHAYTPIVGGGENACILHYTDNNQALRNGDLVLIDCGAEYAHYASDITRTFPVNGRFDARQRALYQVVLEAQEAAIKTIKPGNSWHDPHRVAIEHLTLGLIELGLLKGDLSSCIKAQHYRQYYMHGTGHLLGMDVHDVGECKREQQWRTFEPGMVLTVEPGLYISQSSEAPAEYRGTGIRIEDDVLVTDSGHRVLTQSLEKTADAIEALMAA